MPPRYSYWTILAGGLPTAFRAAEREDLLPTFNRIRDKHSDAEMKWFARGRLWESPEAAQDDLQRARHRRDREWRPGGAHRDPRQTFKKPSAGQTRDRRQARRETPERPPGIARHRRTAAACAILARGPSRPRDRKPDWPGGTAATRRPHRGANRPPRAPSDGPRPSDRPARVTSRIRRARRETKPPATTGTPL